MAKDEGTGGVARKQQLALKLLQQCRYSSCMTLAHPNYRVLADIVHSSQHEKDIERRMEWLHDRARPVTGVPVLTMSAYPVSSVAAVLERVSKSTGNTATCEYKYDGARVQVHLSLEDSKRNRIFSRNMEDVTERYSSLLDVLKKRVAKPLRKRRQLLHNLVEQDPGYVEFVRHIDISVESEDTGETIEAVRECLEQAVAGGCEGLMVKALDDEESEYKAGRRSYSWMKLKHDYLSDDRSTSFSSEKKTKAANASGNGTFLADTLDLVPIGAFHGKGRRAGVFGSFLMATYNSTSGKFETIGKVGTGFSDAQLAEVAARLQRQRLPETDVVPEQYQCITIRSRHPDVWLSPEEVWEVKATQLTESPSYTCGSDEAAPRKGLALRFPRFVRFRTDKNPLQATESEQVVELFNQQQQVQN
eukprot:jgi/Phyca11/5727/fgenesh1_pm.PHYCAscaffold_7_\